MARIVFYGRLADLMGRERTISVGPQRQSILGLIDQMSAGDESRRSALGVKGVKFAINNSIVSSDATVGDGDEVAVMPPFSGG